MPHDLGITGPRDQRKDEYIGKRSLFTHVAKDKARKQFVGLSVGRGEAPLPTGAHVVCRRGQGAPVARLRHLELYEPDPRPAGRARPRGRGLFAHRARRSPSTIWARNGEPRSPPPSRSIRKGSGSMREMAWPPARRTEGSLLDRPRLTARALTGPRACAGLGRSRGGDCGARARRAASRPLCAGAGGRACARASRATGRCSSRRRALGAADGWRDGLCATAVDDGWAAVDVTGADAASALAQGTSADLAAGSPSAAVLFAGLRCLLRRTEAASGCMSRRRG